MKYQGLKVQGSQDPFDELWESEHGTELEDDYNVFDEVDDEDRPDYE